VLERLDELARRVLGCFAAQVGELEGLVFDVGGEGLDAVGEFGVEGFEFWWGVAVRSR
jgi:hypothetical protein